MVHTRMCLIVFLLNSIFENALLVSTGRKSKMAYLEHEAEADGNHYGIVDQPKNTHRQETRSSRKRHRSPIQKLDSINPNETTSGPYLTGSSCTEGPQEKLDKITAKIWRAPASMEIQQSWVHPFCLRFTAIGTEFQKTWDSCQFLGVDWGCVYTTMGMQGGGFSMSMLSTLMGRVTDAELRRGLLTGLEKCEKYWRIYRYEEARRILAHEVQREVEHKTYNGDPSFIIGRPLRSINYNRLRAIRLKKFRDTEKRRKQDRDEIAKIERRVSELQNKKRLSEQEKEELFKLIQPIATSTPRYSVIGTNVQREEQIEMAYKSELGQCIAQEVVLACEPKVRAVILKLL